jgi:hypothetical protein
MTIPTPDLAGVEIRHESHGIDAPHEIIWSPLGGIGRACIHGILPLYKINAYIHPLPLTI